MSYLTDRIRGSAKNSSTNIRSVCKDLVSKSERLHFDVPVNILELFPYEFHV